MAGTAFGMSVEGFDTMRRGEQLRTVPIGRVIDKLDEYLHKNDYEAAERHLRYWLAEAREAKDLRGMLSIRNEQIGLYRKLLRKAEGLEAIEEALDLCIRLGIENTVSMGTTLVNAATAYKAFGMAKRALPLYVQAQRIYEAMLDGGDARLGGLYNNMALTVMELGEYERAGSLLEKAMHIMSQIPHAEGELAITCCNLADLASAMHGEAAEAAIDRYLTRALELLDTQDLPRDGNYAFICEKCADTFGFYGYFLAEQELKKRAEELYEGA